MPTPRRGRGGAVLCALLAALLLCSAAHAEQFGQNKVQYKSFDWKISRTEHFDVYFYEGSEDLAEAVGRIAEQANADYERVLGHKLTAVIPIITYASHNDFEQTNVITSEVGEGVGGFTELFKNRVALPFTGSYDDLRHVIYHELVHVFMFDIVYGGLVESVVRQAYVNPVPLWFAEGLAEYVSQGWDPEAEMILRDLTISDIVVPLDQLFGGYIVYKEGQSALSFIAERYGPEKVAEIVRFLARTHSMDRALEETTGLDTGRLSEEWERWLRKRYWPAVGDRVRAADVATLLTDHTKDSSYFNSGPAVSPDGMEVVYLSDKSGYPSVYVASMLDGTVLRKLVSGERSDAFETLHVLRTGFSWSPDGRRICLIAKAGASDALHIIDAETGRIERTFRFPLDGMFTPAWSPVGDRIAFVGTRRGASDLYATDLGSGTLVQVTDDYFDERDPEWSPDGTTIAFASDRGSPPAMGFRREYDIYAIDTTTRVVSLLVRTKGNESSPAWSPDGRLLAFSSDRDGSPDLFVADLQDSTFARMTNLVGGAESPSWSRDADWLAFSVYADGGWDVASVKDPMDRFAETLRKDVWLPTTTEGLPEGPSAPESLPSAPETPPAVPAAGPEGVAEAPGGGPGPAGGPGAGAESDTVRKLREEFRAAAASDEGGAEPESERTPGTVERYTPRFSPDWVSGGFSYTSGYGFAGSGEIAVSDILGNHRFYLATDFFSNIESSNFYFLYDALGHRVNYSLGLYNFKDYYYSDTTRLGEDLGEKRYFSERSYGASVGAGYPFTKFTRLELEVSALHLDRQFAEETDTGGIQFTDEEVRRTLLLPGVRLVNDTALWGYVGPIGGGRSSLSLSKAWETGGDFTYLTAIADFRRYLRIDPSRSLALKLVGARSSQRNAQNFYLGGVNSLRGYDDFEFHGTNLALLNLEFRAPFIERLDVGSPLPFSIGGIYGVAFFDAGAAWDGDEFRAFEKDGGGTRLRDIKASYGVGIRVRFAFLVLRLDRAWQTDLRETGGARTHFALGPEF